MNRRILWGTGLAAGLVFLLLAAGVLAPVHVPDIARRYFSAEFLSTAAAYNSTRYLIYLWGVFAPAAVLISALALGWHESLGAWAERLTGGRPVLASVLVWVTLTLATTAAELPGVIARTLQDRQFGLSHTPWSLWVTDFAKSSLIGLAIGALLWAALTWIIRRRPDGWWAPAALGFALYLVASSALGPVLLDPLFNTFTPLQDAGLSRAVRTLADQAGLPVQEVLVMDASRRTTRVNAYFAGFGSTRRVVLYDTLLKGYDRRQILSVVAHELGHWRFNHIYIGLALGTLEAALVLWLAQRMLLGGRSGGGGAITGPGRPAQVAALMLFFSLISFAAMPLDNIVSRAFERQADRFAVELTRDPQASVALDVRLARDNLADIAPHPLTVFVLFSHPPVLERVENAGGGY